MGAITAVFGRVEHNRVRVPIVQLATFGNNTYKEIIMSRTNREKVRTKVVTTRERRRRERRSDRQNSRLELMNQVGRSPKEVTMINWLDHNEEA